MYLRSEKLLRQKKKKKTFVYSKLKNTEVLLIAIIKAIQVPMTLRSDVCGSLQLPDITNDTHLRKFPAHIKLKYLF